MAIILSDNLTEVSNEVIVSAGKVAGDLIVSTSVIDVLTEPLVSDVLMYCDLPSNAKIKQLVFYNDDLDSGNTVSIDIGIYAGEQGFRTSDGAIFDPNTEISPEAFSNDENMFFQSNVGEDLRFNENGLAFINLGGYANAQLKLWQLTETNSVNLIEDPFKTLRIGAKIVGGFGTFVPGKTMLQVYYTGKI